MEDNTQNKTHRKIVVVPDKFKGSLTALEAAEAIKEAILHQEPDAQVLLRPMADGGEGSLDVMERAIRDSGRHVEKVAVDTVNPLGGRVRAHFLLYDSIAYKTIPQTGTSALRNSNSKPAAREVFIELAQSTGLQLIPERERDILHATSYGLGEMIRFAMQECGVGKVVLAIGGSATNDGGYGMLKALGYRYKNISVNEKMSISRLFSDVAEIDNSSVKDTCPEIDKVVFEVACDVQNPLLGPNGATMIYAPQKGAGPDVLEELETGMRKWAQVVQKWYDARHTTIQTTSSNNMIPCYEVPGTGAAGGIGFALYSVLGAELVPGWKLFSAMTGLEDDIATADLVITGEGRFDSQSLSGKLPFGIAEICRIHHKPLWVVCGSDRTSPQQKSVAGIDKVISLESFCPDIPSCISNARELIITHLKL